MPIAIIEGPDLAGKSYSIECIAKFFNSGFILKNTYKPRKLIESADIYNQYWHIIGLLSPRGHYAKKKLIILDRFYPSQAVYSILRGNDEIQDFRLLDIQEFCRKSGILYIYLNTDLETLEKRYKERGDEHIKLEQLEMLKNRYDAFYLLCTLKKIKIDPINEDDWLEKIKEFIEGEKDEY